MFIGYKYTTKDANKQWILFSWHNDPKFTENNKDNMILLGSKELGTNVLELHFVMLANHDQNILVLF